MNVSQRVGGGAGEIVGSSGVATPAGTDILCQG